MSLGGHTARVCAAVTTPAVRRDETLAQLFERVSQRAPERVAQRYKGGVYDRSLVAGGVIDPAPDGAYADLTYRELRSIVTRLAAGLRRIGLAPGDRLALAAATRAEWAHVDFATLAAGGVVATIHPAVSGERLQYLLADTGARVVVVADGDGVAAVQEACAGRLLDVEAIVTLDAYPPESTDEDGPPVYTLAEVITRGVAAFSEAAYHSWLDATAPDALASIVYTSGTTGRPKGVMHSHASFRANVSQCLERLGGESGCVTAASTALSVLPLTHVFERMMGHFLIFGAGGTVAYAESPATLTDDCKRVQPTIAAGVPVLYERLVESIPTWDETAEEALGGNIECLIVGGSALSRELSAVYADAGVSLLEGYGLTETAPVVAVTPPDDHITGTVGPPVVGTEIAIDERVDTPDHVATTDPVGELLVRGPQVTMGYWNRPDATRDAFSPPDELPGLVTAGAGGDEGGSDDPWFHTGDVVRLRADGRLVFCARKSRLLTLSTGVTVSSRRVTARLTAQPLIDQCVVLGADRPFLAALIVPDFETAAERSAGLPTARAAACQTAWLREQIETEVARANERLDPLARVERFRLVAEPLTRENGLLTPTGTHNRPAVRAWFSDTIDAIYGENDGTE